MKFVRQASFLAACLSVLAVMPATASTEKAVVEQYTNIAGAVFEDALISARALQKSIVQLAEKPSAAQLNDARQKWIAARVPYQQGEVFRFANAIVDDWEGQVNAWPLDEGLIDYVAPSYQAQLGNEGANLNIIANPVLTFAGEKLDLSTITPELLADLNDFAGSEANVATGYHAIEFLLWGQDLNGTEAGAGNRPYTDFVQGAGCTNGNCDRRVAYLLAVTELLISDLEEMAGQWSSKKTDNYRATLLKEKNIDVLRKMLFGMGSLALGELSGERMKVALEANSPEDEHDCFSDNTHHSHYYNGKGIENLYYGRYKRIDGTVLQGASLADLVRAKDKALADKADKAFAATEKALKAIVDKAEAKEKPMKFDQMVAEGNVEGKKLIEAAIRALVAETRVIEEVASLLGIDNLSPDTADHTF